MRAAVRLVRSGAVARSHARCSVAPRAWFSTPTEVSEAEKEQAEILARMEKDKEAKTIVANVGGLAHIPDFMETLPENRAEVATLDYMHEEQATRVVEIFQEDMHAMTSGSARLRGWYLKFPNQERWSNPVMGWTSSADPMTSVKLTFDTKEQAIAFAEKKGLAYNVKERTPRARKYGKNYYAHNFLPANVEAKLRVEKTSTRHFENPQSGMSNYFRPLKFHGDGQVRQHGPTGDAPIAGEGK